MVYLKDLWVRGGKFKGVYDALHQELETFIAGLENPA